MRLTPEQIRLFSLEGFLDRFYDYRSRGLTEKEAYNAVETEVEALTDGERRFQLGYNEFKRQTQTLTHAVLTDIVK